jgi:hypothetical protein
MDIHVEEVHMAVSKFRIAQAVVKYHELGFYVDICLFKEEKLWVRMPEIWITPTRKRRFFFWVDKADSDRFQEIVLNKVFDMLGLNLEIAIKEKNAFFAKRFKSTEKENNITLTNHDPEA